MMLPEAREPFTKCFGGADAHRRIRVSGIIVQAKIRTRASRVEAIRRVNPRCAVASGRAPAGTAGVWLNRDNITAERDAEQRCSRR
jgi:hypothetical protein